MGRPREEGLKYFNIDCFLDDKVEILESQFGLEGFAVYIKLLQEAYKTRDGIIIGKVNNEFSRWKTFGKRWGILPENLRKIIQFQVELKLWDKKAWEENENLTSNGIQKRLKRINRERRKDRERKDNLPINSFPSGKPSENSGKTQGKPSEKGGKERKGKESNSKQKKGKKLLKSLNNNLDKKLERKQNDGLKPVNPVEEFL